MYAYVFIYVNTHIHINPQICVGDIDINKMFHKSAQFALMTQQQKHNDKAKQHDNNSDCSLS